MVQLFVGLYGLKSQQLFTYIKFKVHFEPLGYNH
jgi:hypothetical protein